VARLKARADRTPRIILCVGPHARYVDVERWSRLVDVVIPEATARETVLRQALALERVPRSGPRPKIAIVSTNFELRTMLVEACRTGGYAVEAFPELAAAPQSLALAWDVPVLELDWPARLATLARSRPVVALIGFADRQAVTLARQAGAVACLDQPFEVADFVDILDRIATFRRDKSHDLPPAPSAKRAVLARKT
jgi:CheY-like chemotaxis protein